MSKIWMIKKMFFYSLFHLFLYDAYIEIYMKNKLLESSCESIFWTHISRPSISTRLGLCSPTDIAILCWSLTIGARSVHIHCTSISLIYSANQVGYHGLIQISHPSTGSFCLPLLVKGIWALGISNDDGVKIPLNPGYLVISPIPNFCLLSK